MTDMLYATSLNGKFVCVAFRPL